MRFSLDENFNRNMSALATVGGHAKLFLQLPKIGHTIVRRLADLLVGDRVADTDVHDFRDL
jgi:hypothetical protein